MRYTASYSHIAQQTIDRAKKHPHFPPKNIYKINILGAKTTSNITFTDREPIIKLTEYNTISFCAEKHNRRRSIL